MEANAAFASLGPTVSVQFNNDALGALAREQQRATEVLVAHDLLADVNESPISVWQALTPTLVPFATLKYELVRKTIMALQTIEARAQETGTEPVIFLVLPNLRFDKSNAWFLLFLWHELAILRERTTAVVGTRYEGHRLTTKLKERYPGRSFSSYMLYVDDMAFSGGQIMNFIGGRPFDPSYSEDHFVPIIAFTTTALFERNRAQGTGISWEITGKTIIYSPAELLQCYTGRNYENTGPYCRLQHYWKTRNIDDKPGSNRIAYNELLRAMSGLVRTDDALCRTNEDVFQAVCTFYRVAEIFKPVFVFEHKLADNVSVSSRYFKFPEIDDAPFPVVTAPPLVNVEGFVEKGSKSFYKDLAWKRLPTPTSFTCHACHEKAQFRCLGCKTALYCSQDCQNMHWREGHANSCDPPK
jgi:hypothetical protein